MKRKIVVLVATLVLLMGITIVPAQAADPGDIEASIEAGIEWLAAQQNEDGSWGYYSEEKPGITGLVLVKLQDRAFEIDGIDSPFDEDYEYYTHVQNGLDYLLGLADTIGIGLQDGEDPDTNGNGLGVYLGGSYTTYNTGIAMMAIAAGRDPTQTVSSGPLTGWNYGNVLQDMADWMSYAQSDFGLTRGGWGYEARNNSGGADQSNGGYATLGLLYAQAPLYGYNCDVPDWVKERLNSYIDYVQNDQGTGDDTCWDNTPDPDGGSGYETPCRWVNSLKTGTLLSQMAYVGDTAESERAGYALDYITRHWTNHWETGWQDDDPVTSTEVQYQATYCIMKGLQAMGIPDDGLTGIADWYDDMATAIIAEQNGDGSWPESPAYVWPLSGAGYEYYVGQEISTAWALLTLERFAPPPPVWIEVEKHWSYTNVCFMQNNDGDVDEDGNPIYDEDGPEYDDEGNLLKIDNDEDGLTDEDPVECDGENYYVGDPLPMAEGGYMLEATVNENKGEIQNINPGQFYAVSTVKVLADLDKLVIYEKYSDVIGQGIGELNPKNGGGKVVVVKMDGEMPVQILDAMDDAVVLYDYGAAEVTLEDVVAGDVYKVYVKFAPPKGADFDLPHPAINTNCAAAIAGEVEQEICVDATIVVVKKVADEE